MKFVTVLAAAITVSATVAPAFAQETLPKFGLVSLTAAF